MVRDAAVRDAAVHGAAVRDAAVREPQRRRAAWRMSMKLEYFDDAFDGSGLLLLYSGGPREVEQLRAAVRRLVVADTSLALHELDFIEPVANCEVTASSDVRGRGVRAVAPPTKFVWSLPPSDWESVAGLLEPFCDASRPESGTSFQYLHDHVGTEVIYSTTRGW